MRKIFLYECKRLLWNKFFAGLVLVLLFYGWQVLRRVAILGGAHTPPPGKFFQKPEKKC